MCQDVCVHDTYDWPTCAREPGTWHCLQAPASRHPGRLYQQSQWRVNALRVMAVAPFIIQYFSNTESQWLRRCTHRRLICSGEGLILHKSLVFELGIGNTQSRTGSLSLKQVHDCKASPFSISSQPRNRNDTNKLNKTQISKLNECQQQQQPFYGTLIQYNPDELVLKTQSDTLPPLSLLSSSVVSICYKPTHLHYLTSKSSYPLHYFLPCSLWSPLGLTPSTTKSIHFFTHSLSSFLNTWPYHLNLLCCNTVTTSSNPNPSLSSSHVTSSYNLTPHVHLYNHSHLCPQ